MSRKQGFVESCRTALQAKRLQLLHELMPTAADIAVLVNPTNADSEADVRELQEAAPKFGLRLHLFNASDEPGFDAAFASAEKQRAHCT